MDKIEKIKLALKLAIEEKYPYSTIHQKAEQLNLSDSQVSKILGRQKTLPIKELLRLEQVMETEIINVVFPNDKSQEKKGNLFIKDVASETILTKKTLYDAMSQTTLENVRQLIDDLEKALNPIINKNRYRFKERPTSTYISINLVPDRSNIYNTNGIHLLFIRLKKDDVIRVQFIIPNEFFKTEIQANKLTKGGTETTYLPFKKTGQTYNTSGQPYIDMENNFLEFKKLVMKLAIRVYELQTTSQ